MNEIMIQIILFFFFAVCVLSLSSIIKKSFSECIPLVFMGVICILFVFGFFSLLKYGIFVCVLFAVVLLSFAIVLVCQRNDKEIIKKEISSFGFVTFGVLFCILSILDYNRLVYFRDDLCHWASVVKVMVYNDSFGTIPEAMLHCAKYPPGISLLQYFFEKIYYYCSSNIFSEWYLFFSYHIFAYIMILPFFKGIRIKGNLSKAIALLYILILSPSVMCFTFFWNLQVEHIIGILFGTGLVVACIYEPDRYTSSFIALNCATLVLTKDAGILLATVITVCYSLRLYKKRKTLAIIFAICATIIPYITWELIVNKSGCFVIFSRPFSICEFAQIMIGHGSDDTQNVIWRNFVSTIGQNTIIINNFGISLSFITGTILLFVFINCVLKLVERNDSTPEVYLGRGVYGIILAIGLIIYVFGLGATYIFKIYGVGIPSFERYVAIYLIGLIVFGICSFVSSICDRELARMDLVLLAIIICMLPLKDITNYLARKYTFDSYSDRTIYTSFMDQIIEYTGLDLNNSKRIFVLEQDGNGDPFWHYKYLLYPNIVYNNSTITGAGNASYTIEPGEEKYNPSKEEFLLEMKNECDLLIIWHTNQYFLDNFNDCFDEPEMLSDKQLYVYNDNTGKMKLVN